SDGGNPVGEDRDQIAVRIVGGQGLIKDPRAVEVLRSSAEMWIQQGRCLPPEDAQGAAAAAPDRPERRFGLRMSAAGWGEHSGRHRCGQPERGHRPDECAPGEVSRHDLADHFVKPVFVHGRSSEWLTLSASACSSQYVIPISRYIGSEVLLRLLVLARAPEEPRGLVNLCRMPSPERSPELALQHLARPRLRQWVAAPFDS